MYIRFKAIDDSTIEVPIKYKNQFENENNYIKVTAEGGIGALVTAKLFTQIQAIKRPERLGACSVPTCEVNYNMAKCSYYVEYVDGFIDVIKINFVEDGTIV